MSVQAFEHLSLLQGSFSRRYGILVSVKIVKSAICTLKLVLTRVHPRGFPGVIREFLFGKAGSDPLFGMRFAAG